MKEKVNLPPALLESVPWKKEQKDTDSIWPLTHFLLRRNLAKFPFPPNMTEAQSEQSLELIRQLLLRTTGTLDRPLFYKAEDLSALDREFLFEHFFSPDSFQNTLAGQGFLIENTGQLLATVNLEDHLRLQLLDTKGDFEKSWNALSQLETTLGNSLEFAFSPKFGYLTSDPSCCGTGLTVSCYLHLPALIHTEQLQEALLKQKEENVTATSMQGTTDTFVGDFVVLKNRYTLGQTEENILHALQTTAMKLIVLEKTLRAHLKETSDASLKDKMSRAYGLLIHSYQLQTKETLDALSLMKLAIDLGQATGMTDQALNQIIFKSPRAHLTYALKDLMINLSDIPRKRAEFLHSELKNIVLKT